MAPAAKKTGDRDCEISYLQLALQRDAQKTTSPIAFMLSP